MLAGIREVMGKTDRMATTDLLCALWDKEDAPWGELRGKPITNIQLARLLREYDIAPKVMKIDGVAHRGYSREQFWDAWLRYLPSVPENPVTGVTDETGG